MVITSRSLVRVCGVAHSLGARRWRCGSQTLRPTLHRLVACTVTVAAVCATAARAQLNNPDIWLQNPGSTAFGVGTNWSKGTVPTAVNDVRVDSTSTQFPVLIGGSYSTGPVYLSYDGGSQTSSLTIQNGGTLNTSLNSEGVGVVMAIQPSTSATVTATGAGSQLTTIGSIWVGTEGSGTLNILDGAKVQSQGRDVAIGLGFTPTGTGSVLVTGAGSVLSVAGALIVGSSAAGSLNVANQATVNAGNAFIGEFAGGFGTLTISNQAAVSLSALTLAFSPGGQGALNIGASPGSAPSSPGTLTAGAIFFGNGSGVVNFNHTASNYVFATAIIGAGSVNLFSGTTILAGNNSNYTGSTHLNGGIAAVSNQGNLGAGALSFDGGTLEALAAGGGITLNNAVTLNGGGGTFLADAGTTSTLSGAISGIGSLDKAGLGILVLTGVNNSMGPTTVSAGTLLADSSTALSANSAYTVNSVLDLNGFNNTIGSLSGNGTVTNNGRASATLTVGGNNISTTFSGTLTDGISSLGLNKTGVGTMILTGSNTYTGGTTISAGALQIGDGGLTGSINGNVTDNGTLIFDRSNTLSFAGSAVLEASSRTVRERLS